MAEHYHSMPQHAWLLTCMSGFNVVQGGPCKQMQLNMSMSAEQICFFAHSPEEVRHPTTKPFVPPEALAAATTNATLEAMRKAAADSAASQKEVKPLLQRSTPQKWIALNRLWHQCYQAVVRSL